MNLASLIPSLTLKERPIRDLVGENGFELLLEDVPKNTMVYLKSCTSGSVTVRSKITKLVFENCDDILITIEAPLIAGHIDIISSKNLTAFLTHLVPVINIERSSACSFHLFREDPQQEFSLVSATSSGLTILENQANYQVPTDVEKDQFMTRVIEGRWLTEKIIRENGYQTTEREKEINVARAERDEKILVESMKNTIKVTPSSSFHSGITQFPKRNLKPTTTVVKTVGDMMGLPKPKPQPSSQDHVEDETTEYHDDPLVLEEKVKSLAKMIKKAKHSVGFTGAGISTSTGLPTYRGPNGVWTRRDQGLAPLPSVAMDTVNPAPAHMALVKLVQQGLLKHVVSTNVDGLHRRSGLSEEELSELHGNCYKENCKDCGKEYLRKHDTTSAGCRPDHLTGGVCDACSGPLLDNIVNFGETLPEKELSKAIGHAEKGDLALVLGTSMKVSPACNIPDKIWKKKEGAMVIVNLQRTPFDRYCALRIFGETDLVLQMLMEQLELTVPEFVEK